MSSAEDPTPPTTIETEHEVCSLINGATSVSRLEAFYPRSSTPDFMRKDELRYDRVTTVAFSPSHHVRMRVDVTVTIEAFDPTEVRR